MCAFMLVFVIPPTHARYGAGGHTLFFAFGMGFAVFLVRFNSTLFHAMLGVAPFESIFGSYALRLGVAATTLSGAALAVALAWTRVATPGEDAASGDDGLPDGVAFVHAVMLEHSYLYAPLGILVGLAGCAWYSVYKLYGERRPTAIADEKSSLVAQKT